MLDAMEIRRRLFHVTSHSRNSPTFSSTITSPDALGHSIHRQTIFIICCVPRRVRSVRQNNAKVHTLIDLNAASTTILFSMSIFSRSSFLPILHFQPVATAFRSPSRLWKECTVTKCMCVCSGYLLVVVFILVLFFFRLLARWMACFQLHHTSLICG